MDLHPGRRTVCLCWEPRSIRLSKTFKTSFELLLCLLLCRGQSHRGGPDQGTGSSFRLGLCAIAQAGRRGFAPKRQRN